MGHTRRIEDTYCNGFLSRGNGWIRLDLQFHSQKRGTIAIIQAIGVVVVGQNPR